MEGGNVEALSEIGLLISFKGDKNKDITEVIMFD